MKQNAPAALRNSEPIRIALAGILPEQGRVLEIASGTGQHALAFAHAFPKLQWQASDRESDALASIRAWRAESGLANLPEPVLLDASDQEWGFAELDAIFCANMIHISPWASCLGLLDGAARSLRDQGLLILYGPFREQGVLTAASNESFDASLRARDARWGLRLLQEVEGEAARRGLARRQRVQMPANNLIIVFQRSRAQAMGEGV